MPPISPIERALWLLTLFASALTIVRLYQLQLHRIYRFFFLYLLVRECRSAALLPFNVNDLRYGWIWVLTEPILWFFQILVVLELYSLVLKQYRGLYTLGRWALYGALSLAVLISALTLAPGWNTAPEQFPVLLIYVIIERGIAFSLVVFLLLILAFLTWLPVPLSRNIIIHSFVYCVFFISNTMLLFIRNVGGHSHMRAVSTAMLAVALLCQLMWLLFLTRRGESHIVLMRCKLAPDDERRLLDQLQTINGALLRAAGK